MKKINKIYSNILRINQTSRHTLISLFQMFFITFFGFIATMYIARKTGPEIYGVYSLFIAYYSIITILRNFGFEQAAVKKISEGENQNSYFTAFLAINVISLPILLLILFIIQPYLSSINEYGLFNWMLLAVIISSIYTIFITSNFGTGKVGVFQAGLISDSFFRIIFQVIAVFFGYYIMGLVGGLIIGFIAGMIVNIPFNTLKLSYFSYAQFKTLMAFSLWVFLVNASFVLLSNIDKIAIGYYLSNADVGIYTIAFQLTSVATFGFMAFQSVIYPKISYMSINGEIEGIERLLSKSMTYSLSLAIPSLIGGFLLGYHILYYFYEASYASGYYSLIILFVCQIANVFVVLISTTITAMNMPKSTFKVTFFGTILNILLNILFIPLFGIIGAAISTLITMSIISTLLFISLSKLIKIKLEKTTFKNIIIAASAMLIPIAIYRLFVPIDNFFLVLLPILIGGIVYCTTLVKLDTAIRNEILDILIQMGIIHPKSPK
ncbi:flippase [Methanochimaera problematica]|uniref:flippase n=1 Tax=Methanochimaera problematica TaxID=2609417 RepID=UPI0029390EA7|nr:flippase [Methanoplanus sp. FWC-SCC4]